MTRHHSAKVKVLYIAGLGRSGSTILDNILGQIEGFFSVGEVHRLWDSGPIENRICGCGRPLAQCDTWQAILQEGVGGSEQIAAQKMIRIQKQAYRTRHLLRLLAPGGRAWLAQQLGSHLLTLGHLYRAMKTTTQSQVIVDSSKFPSYAFVLDSVPDIELYVLHLVRDARAVAYSWQHHKLDPGTGESLGTIRPFKSAALWLVWNFVLQVTWHKSPRYLRLYYEDFVANPRATVENIVQFVGCPRVSVPFINDTQIQLASTHSVCGNPVRYDAGITTIKPDTRWQTKMTSTDKWLVSFLDWPLLWWYQYL